MRSKLCTRCGRIRSLSDFNLRNASKGTYQSWCKPCFAEHAKDKYRSNREKDRKRRNSDACTSRAKQFIANYLADHPCVDCGNTDPRVLEFDHVTGEKLFNIADAAVAGFSVRRIKKEIAKCQVRCANCHRIKTGQRAGRWS